MTLLLIYLITACVLAALLAGIVASSVPDARRSSLLVLCLAVVLLGVFVGVAAR